MQLSVFHYKTILSSVSGPIVDLIIEAKKIRVIGNSSFLLYSVFLSSSPPLQFGSSAVHASSIFKVFKILPESTSSFYLHCCHPNLWAHFLHLGPWSNYQLISLFPPLHLPFSMTWPLPISPNLPPTTLFLAYYAYC